MNNFKFVSFSERLIAAIIDGCILSVIEFIFLLSSIFIVRSFTTEEHILEVFAIIIWFVMWLIYILYYDILESSKWQGTIGKYAMKITVVDKNGGKLSFWRAFFRAFTMMFTTMFCYIGWLAILWTKNKQTWHDKLAKCYVVRK